MDTLESVRVASISLEQLKVAGFEVEATTRFDDLPKLVDEMGKPYLSPLLSPARHDFTDGNSFWLILRALDGVAVGCVGARLEDLGSGRIDDYWKRVFERHFPDTGPISVTLAGSAETALSGRLAYIGDLFVAPAGASNGLGRHSKKYLFYLLHLMHAIVALEWRVSAAYAFISPRDALRGAAGQYGFTIQLPRQKRWRGDAPPGRYNDECLVILPAKDRPAVFRQAILNNSE